MECSHCSLDQTTFIQHLHPTDRPLCIRMLGSNQSRHTFRRLWSVVSATSTWNYLAGPHHQHRGPWTHWCTCCQRDHISVKTVCARPHVANATLQSHLPRHSFGLAEMTWQTSTVLAGYTEICGKSIFTWTMFLNLLLWCMLLMMLSQEWVKRT